MNKVIVTFLGIITAVILLVGGFYLGQQMSSQPAPKPSSTPTLTASPSATPAETKGTVEGSLGYPSEGIPENMFVCAETLEGQKVACTDTQIEDDKFEYGLGYQLKLDPGNYYLYAKLPEDDYKAYYTEFVSCGLSVECTSHGKIKVIVESGETISNIDPVDWYDTGSNE
jgi:hypothetical protein